MRLRRKIQDQCLKFQIENILVSSQSEFWKKLYISVDLSFQMLEQAIKETDIKNNDVTSRYNETDNDENGSKRCYDIQIDITHDE